MRVGVRSLQRAVYRILRPTRHMARTLIKTPFSNRRKSVSAGLALLVAAYIVMQNVSAWGQNPIIGEQMTALDPRMESAGGIAPFEYPAIINFSGALMLAVGQNPQIGFANEQINEAFAQLKGAKVLVAADHSSRRKLHQS